MGKVDLSTNYMGLKFRNPLVAGSSSLTIDTAKVKKLVEAGVGGIVLKSLFEEQIRAESSEMYDALVADSHPEALEYLQADLPMRMGPSRYLEHLSEIKGAVDVPVLASVNCVTPNEWPLFARQLEAAGADGLEINVYDIADDPEIAGPEVEERHLAMLRAVKAAVDVPVAVKIAPFYSSPLHFMKRLSDNGADAIVLFNRFFQPDIDIHTMSLQPSLNLSHPTDLLMPLRWLAMARDVVDCDLCLTTGVHDSRGLTKALLSGANAVQIASVLYVKEMAVVGTMLEGLEKWMEPRGYGRLDDFRGRMSASRLTDQKGFERAHYMKALVGAS